MSRTTFENEKDDRLSSFATIHRRGSEMNRRIGASPWRDDATFGDYFDICNYPILNALPSQIIVAVVWTILSIIACANVWYPADAPPPTQEKVVCSPVGEKIIYIMLFVLVYVLVFGLCAWRIHSNDVSVTLSGVYTPYVGLYSAFRNTQFLYKFTILLTAAGGLLMATRAYYILSETKAPFPEDSAFFFMLMLSLFGYLGIFQLTEKSVKLLYGSKSGVEGPGNKNQSETCCGYLDNAFSEILHYVFTVCVFCLSLWHMAHFTPPQSCLDFKEMDGARKTMFAFTLISFILFAVSFVYMRFIAKPPTTIWDTLARNFVGLTSHICYILLVSYFLLYFAMGWSQEF